MKKRLFFTCALVASALLLAVPAMGQTITVTPDPDEVTLGAITDADADFDADTTLPTDSADGLGGSLGKFPGFEAAVWIDTATGGTDQGVAGSNLYAGFFHNGDSEWKMVPPAGFSAGGDKTYRIVGFSIDNFSTKTVHAAAIAAADLSGNYVITTDVSISGELDDAGTTTGETLRGFTVGGVGDMTGNITTQNITVINSGTGNTVGLEIGTDGNEFQGALNTGIITVTGKGSRGGAERSVTSGISIWGAVTGSTAAVGDITVEAEMTHAEAGAYGMVVISGTSDSTFSLGNTINVTNTGVGGAMGLSVDGSGENAVTFSGSMIVGNEGTGNATGIQVAGDDSSVTLSGSIQAKIADDTSAAAVGISMMGDGAIVNLGASASIDAIFDDGTDVVAHEAVGFSGNGGILNLADGFNNGTDKVFNTSGMATVDFKGAANLAEGQFVGVNLENINVTGAGNVALGEEFTINTAQSSLTFTTATGGTFATDGSVIVGTTGNSGIVIGNDSNVELRGYTVLQGNATIKVGDDAVLGFNLEKTNLNTDTGVKATSLAFDLTDAGSKLVVFGDVSTDKAYLNAWKDEEAVDQSGFERQYATITFEDPADYAAQFESRAGGTEWKVVEHEGLNQFIIVPYASGDMFMSDGFLVALGMHNRYAAWHTVRDRLISGSGVNRNGYRGQNPCDAICGPCDAACDPCDAACGTVRRNGTRNAWVNYTGRSDTLGTNGFLTNNWRISAEGIQAGADLFLSRNSQFGVLFGYEGGRARNTNDLLKMDDVYFGLYGARVLRNGYDVRGVVALGWQDFDYTRDNFGTLETASFKGHSAEVNLELGRRISSYRSAWSIRPVIALDVFNNNVKSATDSQGYVYAKSHLTQAFLRFGSDLRYQRNNLTFNSGFYYSYDMNDDVLRTSVGGIGTGTLSGAKLGRNLLTFNVGTDYQVTRNFSLFGGYQGEYATDRDNSQVHSTGYVGAGFKW